MGDLTEGVVEWILELEGTVIYVLVAIFSWAEAAFFLGFVTPGEIAIAAGGVLASRGQAMLLWVGVAAAVGTVIGNSTGFWLGRVWGDRVLEWRPVSRLLGGFIGKAQAFFMKRGEWAIVGSRVSSFLRISVPFIAGSSGMSYRRFVLFDAPSGIAWALIWVGIGFVLGESWRALLSTAGPAAFLVLILFVAALVIGWLAVRAARQQRWIVEGTRRIILARPTVYLLRKVRPPLAWIGRRFSPGVAGGLQLTFGFLALVIGAGVAGLVVSQTRAVQGLALLDFPVLEWMVEARTDEAQHFARTGLRIFRVPGLVVPTVLIFLVGWWRGTWMTGLRAALGLAGAGVGAYFLDQEVLEGVVPRAEFPSVPVAVAGALLVHGIAIAGRGMAWGAGVAAAAGGLFLVCAVALATVVAGIAAPSGIVLGFAIGLLWAAILEVPIRIPWSAVPE